MNDHFPRVAAELTDHVDAVRACVRCPRMRRPAVPGYPTVSRAMLIGQAPGRHEPIKRAALRVDGGADALCMVP